MPGCRLGLFLLAEVVSVARLTEKQRRFVAEYLVDLNATQAAKRAGYKDPNIGRQLITKNNVSEEIQKSIKKQSKRTEITQDRVLLELANIAFSNGTDFAKVVGQGARQMVELTPTDDIPVEKRAAISGIEETKYGIKVSSYDKVRALELLGKHLGMFDGKPQQINETNLLEAIAEASSEGVATDDIPEIE